MRVYNELCRVETLQYQLEGYGSRELELLPDFTMGRGAAHGGGLDDRSGKERRASSIYSQCECADLSSAAFVRWDLARAVARVWPHVCEPGELSGSNGEV